MKRPPRTPEKPTEAQLQAERDYDATPEGIAEMHRRFAEGFAAEEWDDIFPPQEETSDDA